MFRNVRIVDYVERVITGILQDLLRGIKDPRRSLDAQVRARLKLYDTAAVADM